MCDPESDNTSPPLPSQGAYSFNFDEVDEFTNPFQPKKALSSSPPKVSSGSPFQGKSKLSSSPPHSSPSVTEKIEQDTIVNDTDASSPQSQDTPKPHPDTQKEPVIPTPSLTPDSKCNQGATVKNESSISTPNITPDSKSSNSEASPQTYYSAVEAIEEENSGDVWCDAEENVDSFGIGEANITGESLKSHPDHAVSPQLTNSSKVAGPQVPVSKADQRKGSRKAQEARPSEKKAGKKLVIDENSGGTGDAVEVTGGKEEGSLGSAMSEEVKQVVGKVKKSSSKEKDTAVIKGDGADGKMSSKFGKEGQTVEEKDTDTKLQDVALAEKPEAVAGNEMTKKKSTVAAVKRKTKSKFKKPADNEQNEVNVEIFSPPQEKLAVRNMGESDHDLTEASLSASLSASGVEVMHEFGAAEDAYMLEEANEGFVTASEVLPDASAWRMLDGGDTDMMGAGRESRFVNQAPSVHREPDLSKRKVQRTGSSEVCTASTEDVTGASKSLSGGPHTNTQHPAARVLDERLDSAGRELNGEQLAHAKGTMSGESKDAVVQLVQDIKGGEEVLKYSQSDWNKKHQELELDFQTQLLSKEKEWSKKLADRDKRIANLDEQTRHARQTNEDMRMVITEFEKTISLLQADKEKNTTASQQSLQEAIRERDQASEDLHSVEAAFAGLHQRYEKTKGIIDGFKQNEGVLKKCLEETQAKLKKSEEKLLQLKKQAEDKFEKVSLELDRERKVHATEMARLQASVKKCQLQIQGLETSLQQKIEENQELTSICDELIAKVGVE